MPSRSKALSHLQLATSEGLACARARVEKLSAEVRNAPLVLFGAGTLGLHTLEGLRSAGIDPIAFADDTPGKQGTLISGIPVVAPADVTDQLGSEIAVVVTMMTSRLSFLQAKQILTDLGVKRVFSFLHAAWAYANQFLPYYQFELPDMMLSKSEEILAGAELWYDDESIWQYVHHLLFRLTLDFDLLPINDHEGYYPSRSIAELPTATTFVDCGAYDGDTVREFLNHQADSFHAIHAFEPDPDNYRKLQAYVAALKPHISSRISCYKAGTGDRRGNVSFDAAGNMSSSLTEKGTTAVEIVRLDDINIESAKALFIKLDVEGFERESLLGARKLIEEQTPLIALSAYHRPNDLWELPRLLRELNANYRFFLRTHGEDGMDVICYAVPLQLLTT